MASNSAAGWTSGFLLLAAAFPAASQAQSPPWEPHTLRTLRVEGGSVDSLAFSPDGDFLAVGGSSGEVVLWHLPDETVVARFVCPDAGVQQVTFLDGGRLLTVDPENVCLWDLRYLATPVWQLPFRMGTWHFRIPRAAVSHDQTLVAFPTARSTVGVFDLSTATPLRSLHLGLRGVSGVEFLEGDDELLVLEDLTAVHVWKWTEESAPERIEAPWPVASLAVLAGNVPALGAWGAGLRLGDRLLETEGAVSGLVTSGDGRRIAARLPEQVQVLDSSGTVLGEVRHGTQDVAVALDSTGERLATAGRDGRVRIWRDFELVQELEGPAVWRSWDLDFSRDGESLGVLLPDGRLRVFALEDGTAVDVNVQGTCVAPGQRGGELLVGERGRVLECDPVARRTEVLCTVPRNDGERIGDTSFVSIAPDGDELLLDCSSRRGGGVYRFLLKTGVRVEAIEHHVVCDLAWNSPRQELLVAGLLPGGCGNGVPLGDILAVPQDPALSPREVEVDFAPRTVDVSPAGSTAYWSDRFSTFRARYPELEPVEGRPERSFLFRCVDGESAVSCDGDRLVCWNLNLFAPQAGWVPAGTASGWVRRDEQRRLTVEGNRFVADWKLLKARYNPARRRLALVRDREIVIVELR